MYTNFYITDITELRNRIINQSKLKEADYYSDRFMDIVEQEDDEDTPIDGEYPLLFDGHHSL